MQDGDRIYFEESSKGDTFAERDQSADGFVINLWVNGNRKAKVILSPEEDECYLETNI